MTNVKSFYKTSEFHRLKSFRTLGSRDFNIDRIFSEKGSFSVVYCLSVECDILLKLPRSAKYREHLRKEVLDYRKLKHADFPVARILNSEDELIYYLLKEKVIGVSASDIKSNERYSIQMIFNLAQLFVKAFENELFVDVFHIDNFIWNESLESFVLVDARFREFEKKLNVVSLTEWENAFFSTDELKSAFRFAIKSLKGVDFLQTCLQKTSNTAILNHALHHDMCFMVMGK